MSLHTKWQPSWAGAACSRASSCRSNSCIRCVRAGVDSNYADTSRQHVPQLLLQGFRVLADQQQQLLPPQPSLPHLQTAQQQQQQQQPKAWSCCADAQAVQQPAAAAAAARQRPDHALFQKISSCASWGDCLQLLAQHGLQLDAMLISKLCTHTVYLHELQQYRLSAQDGPALGSSPVETHSADGSSNSSSSSSSNNNGGLGRDSSSSNSSKNRQAQEQADAAACRQQFMQQLSQLALSRAQSGTFRGQQFSNVLWCFARCRHKLPQAWLQEYLAQAQPQLHRFPPRNLSQLIWAAAALQAALPSPFTAAFLAASGRSMQWFRAIDIANTLWGLAKLRAQPPGMWLHAALAACARCWSHFKPFELSITVWALAKLGVTFRPSGLLQHQHQQPEQQPQHRQQELQQQQEWATSGPHTPDSPAAALAAGSGAAAAGAAEPGLQEAGFGWLLGSIALLTPALGLQGIANLVWGLAVGRAALSRQQVQALGDHAFIILAQSMPPTPAFAASLAVSTWALTRLSWAPTLPQARMLVRLLIRALCCGALDARHASMLLFSLGQLGVRLPEAVMRQLMECLAGQLQVAGMADVLQVLLGFHRLHWRVGKSWWGGFYRDSLAAVQQGNAAELVLLAATIASFRPVRPTNGWWEVFWDSMGVELEATLAARGLTRICHTRNLPMGRISVAAAPLKAKAKQHGQLQAHLYRERKLVEALQKQMAQWRPSSGSKGVDGAAAPPSSSNAGLLSEAADAVGTCTSSSSSSSSSGTSGSCSSSSARREWEMHPLAWLSMAEALQIVTNLRGASTQQQGAEQQQQQAARDAVVTGTRAAVLLWACARLKRMPPKALLWQLLLLVLVDAHSLSAEHVALALWSVAKLVRKFGRHQVECFKLIKPIALVAQWRLLTGLAGSESGPRTQLLRALWAVALEDGRLMALLLLPLLRAQTRAHCVVTAA